MSTAAEMPQKVRTMAVQMETRQHASVDAFYARVEAYVRMAADYGADFVTFPELFTCQLLTAEHHGAAPAAAIEALTAETERWVYRLREMAQTHGINIIGGSHVTRIASGHVRNIAYVALRDGTMHAQEKIHPTPDERSVWNVEGGDAIHLIETDRGPVAVLICYDSEFPELARHAVDMGARILFVPFCTDTRPGHLRVRYCCQARAVENQCYVVTAGNVGTLMGVANMELQYGQSAILTPSDHPFARDGIAAEATENAEMAILADLDLGLLDWAREKGAVRNLGDRRPDLYRSLWTGPR